MRPASVWYMNPLFSSNSTIFARCKVRAASVTSFRRCRTSPGSSFTSSQVKPYAERVLLHARVQVGVPSHCAPSFTSAHRAEHELRVQVVRQARHELRLDRRRVRQQREVVRQFLMFGDDDALAARVEPGPARATEDLLNVQDAEVPEPALGRVVQLRALDDDGVRGKVNPPRQASRCSTKLSPPPRRRGAPRGF